jgi:hypothetical protein
MASPFRQVYTEFWSDPNVVEFFTPEDKYFYLYLFTNEHTSQCGIYKIAQKQIAFEMGYSIEAVKNLIDRFQNNLKRIVYNSETHEIAILNWAKYNYPTMIKDNRFACIAAELAEVKDRELVEKVLGHAAPDIRDALLGQEPPKGEGSPSEGPSEPLPSPLEPPSKPLGEEKEKEEEQEEEREARAPTRDDASNQKTEEKDLPALARHVATFWSGQYVLATGVTIVPDTATLRSAANMVRTAGLRADVVNKAIAYYFEHWREFWFACSRDSWKGPPESRRCEFSIKSLEKNLPEVLSRMASKPAQREHWSTSVLKPEDYRISEEEQRNNTRKLGAFVRSLGKRATMAAAN